MEGDPIPRPNDSVEVQDPEQTAVVGEASAAPEMDEKLTLFQWIERLSYRFLGHAITSFVIRRRFVLTRVFLVFMYWLVGVQYYSSKEGWTEYDAAYYITVTTTTVGYGDYHPSTDETRLFTVFYAIFGIAFVLTAVTDIINYVIVRKLQPRVLSWLNVTKMETKAWFKIIFSGMCILTMIAVGTAFFQTNEGWSTTMAFYWTMITMLTIGYGDTPNGVPINDSSRKFSIWFIWTCVVIYIMALSNIYDTFEELKNEALRKEILRAHRVDIVEQLEKDRKGRDTLASNTPRGILSFTRASLASIYPESDEIRYENSPIDSNRQGDIELAVGSTKPTISPLMNNDSLKALIKSESTTTEVLAESKSITPTSSVSSPTVFFGSRGSIEPTRNSSVSDSRSSSLYQGAQRRGSMFDDLDVLQSKTNAFVLDMLIKMKKVDKEKDIDPLVKHFEKIGVMREENKDVSKEVRTKSRKNASQNCPEIAHPSFPPFPLDGRKNVRRNSGY
jgi:Ion channel